MIKFILYFMIHYLINKIFVKKEFLIDQIETSAHKKKIVTNSITPLSGGFIFIIIFPFIDISQNYILLFSLLFLYILGLMSDINYISSPKIRIILQTVCILIFIIMDDLLIKSLSNEILDKILTLRIFNVFFLLICLLVLVNGFNFLDGINTLLIGNFIISLIFIYYASKNNDLILDFVFIENLLILFFVIYIFNFFGKSFLGDSGAYAISFLVGVIFINFAYKNYLFVSPYFIASILWYPAIENLFSIVRRLYSSNRLSEADNSHLHHFLYMYFTKIFFKKSNLFINTFTGAIINIYLIMSAFIATLHFNNTKILLLIILINSFFYFCIYYFLSKKKIFSD